MEELIFIDEKMHAVSYIAACILAFLAGSYWKSVTNKMLKNTQGMDNISMITIYSMRVGVDTTNIVTFHKMRNEKI